MNNFFKNIFLLIVVLVLSYFTAGYFGLAYDNLTPGSIAGGAWIGTDAAWQSIVGAPLAFIFFTILIFKSFGWGNANKWIGWLLILPSMLFISGDLKHIYLPIILAIIAFGLAKLIQLIISRFKMQNQLKI